MDAPATRSLWRPLGSLLLGVGLLLAAVSPALAASATHVQIEIHDSFVDDFLSDACGTLVIGSVDATLNVTLQYRDGLIVKEVDPSGGGKNTLSAPETGQSISFPFNTVIIDYGSGAAIGSPFTITFNGVIGNVPGHIAADAGHAVFSGVVDGFDELGLPSLNITDFVSFNGRQSDGGTVLAATCEALAG